MFEIRMNGQNRYAIIILYIREKKGFDRVLPKGRYRSFLSIQFYIIIILFFIFYGMSYPGHRKAIELVLSIVTRFILYCTRGFHCGTGITRSAAGHLVPYFWPSAVFEPRGKNLCGQNLEKYTYKVIIQKIIYASSSDRRKPKGEFAQDTPRSSDTPIYRVFSAHYCRSPI